MNPGAWDGYQAERQQVRAGGPNRPQQRCRWGGRLIATAVVASPGPCMLRRRPPAFSAGCLAPLLLLPPVPPLQLLDAFRIPGCNAVVHAGDSHNSWAHELKDAHGRR